jgi:3-deoxy-7-phosphoheptulonate synthase
MIVVIRTDAGEEGVAAAVAQASALGLTHHLSRGAERAVLIVGGGNGEAIEAAFRALPAVEAVLPLTRPYRLASREVHPADTIIEIGGLLIGAGVPAVIAGAASPNAAPDAIETAVALHAAGAGAVRTGVYRPTTALYGTPQLDPQALQRLDTLRRAAGAPVVVEALDAADVPAIARHADVLIVSGAQMHSRPLLEACGWSNRPVVLERAESAKLDVWLQAADQILACGNHQVVLCEAGILTYEPSTPATLDISAAPFIRRVSHLPVLVAPGRRAAESGAIEALSLAAVAAGAHGLLLDLSDGATVDLAGALSLAALTALCQRLRDLASALQR